MALLGAIALSALPAAAQTYVRSHDDVVIGAPRASRPAGPARHRPGTTVASALTTLAFHGEVLEDGGTLDPLAFSNPATINGSATIAFFSLVDGVERNQGIFVADGSGVRTIVRGCGTGGGTDEPGTACGDPAPAGGTFSGLYGGTFFAPAINDGGDVLFFADVFRKRRTTRGLFLYRAADQKIVKVAKVGDRSPLGARLGAVGLGSLNNNGAVAFLAQAKPTSSTGVSVLLWHAGRLSKGAAVGDPAPGGGTFSALSTETVTLSSGGTVPVGPVPSINDHGQLSFRANVTGGVTEQGLIVSTNGVNQWYVKAGDATPVGGTFVDFWAPILNTAGDIAFLADYAPSPGDLSSAWFVGSPQSGWRKVLGLRDPVDGGECISVATSRNPMHPLDENGDLVVWSTVQMPGGQVLEKLLAGAADGTLSTVASGGDPTPLGGRIGTIQPWASQRQGRSTVSATTPGALNGVINAHMVSGAAGGADVAAGR